ncbi:hypothetical protein [Aliivibrio fischeri]|uniref:Uncharacterized protein n=1 Tax=Aliivibrio fischeri TaxID=668 RepID=A0A844P8S3_ALIFS|nr:hypothetical protein [Aliivibrio fischeri]MUK51517.1 hypothetical protein [Aliivibrio fischeri]
MEDSSYSTIEIWVKNQYLPKNLQSLHWEDSPETEVCLSVSPNGRLRKKLIYLDSFELAVDYTAYLKTIFNKRVYRDSYRMEIKYYASTNLKLIKRWKVSDSKTVRDLLSGQ